MKKLRTWHEFLIEKLADREKAISYLQVSLEEYLIDRDVPFFLKGLRNVVEAQGGISEIAKQAGIPPRVLSKSLFSEESIQLDIFSAILKALGWQLSIESMTTEHHSSDSASEQLTTSNEPLETSTEPVSESHSA